MNVIGQLTLEQYHKWQTAMYKQVVAELRLKVAQQHHAMMEKDIENAKLRVALNKASVLAAGDVMHNAQSEFASVRAALEAELGFNLSNVAFNEHTLEVLQAE